MNFKKMSAKEIEKQLLDQYIDIWGFEIAPHLIDKPYFYIFYDSITVEYDKLIMKINFNKKDVLLAYCFFIQIYSENFDGDESLKVFLNNEFYDAKTFEELDSWEIVFKDDNTFILQFSNDSKGWRSFRHCAGVLYFPETQYQLDSYYYKKIMKQLADQGWNVWLKEKYFK